MPEIVLAAETGRVLGSRSSSRLRKAGRIPGVIYGHGIDPISIAVNARELRNALSTDAGLNAVLELDVEGTKHLTLAKSIQRDPVRNTVAHVDFQIVRRDEVMTVEVPIALIGEATEVDRAGGVVDQQLHTLTIQSTPGNIPNHIEIDISGLQVGSHITVADIKLPGGASTDLDPETILVAGQGAQVVDLGEEAEAAEGEGGEAAEGDAADGEAAEGEGGDADAAADAPAEG